MILALDTNRILSEGKVGREIPGWVNKCLDSTSQIVEVPLGNDLDDVKQNTRSLLALVLIFFIFASFALCGAASNLILHLLHFCFPDHHHHPENTQGDDNFLKIVDPETEFLKNTLPKEDPEAKFYQNPTLQ